MTLQRFCKRLEQQGLGEWYMYRVLTIILCIPYLLHMLCRKDLAICKVFLFSNYIVSCKNTVYRVPRKWLQCTMCYICTDDVCAKFRNFYVHADCKSNDYNVKQGKAIPLQASTGPEGSRRLRLPGFKTIGT